MKRLAVIAVLASCGQDSHGGAYVSIEMYNSAYKEAWCTHLVTCGLFADLASCEATSIAGPVVEIDQDTVAAILAGKMYYDGGKFAQCVAGLSVLTCDRTDADGRTPMTACFNVFRGTVKGSAECSMDIECVSQACMRNCGELSCCMGTCLGDTPPPVVSKKPIGQSCDQGGCVATAYCEPQTQICTALKSANTSCTNSSECAFGLGCVQASPQVCLPLPTLGQPCPHFVSPICRDEGQFCDPTGEFCRPLGLPGSPCDPNAMVNTCSPYYRCDLATSMCKALPAIGEPCEGLTCGNDLEEFCSSPALICEARRAEGDSCTPSDQCTLGFFCDPTQHCAAIPPCI